MKVTEEVVIGGRKLVLEAGQVARKAHGAMVVRHESSMLLATVVSDGVVSEKHADPDNPFVPLTVEYRERMSAAGRIPGGFGKRETRLGDHEVLTSRLIDRSLRPLFPNGPQPEVQLLVTVFGADPKSDLESLALIAAAGAIALSPLPLAPVAGLRVARRGERTVVLPNENERNQADLELMIAATRDGLVMIEGGGAESSDPTLLAALGDAMAALAPLFDAFERLRAAVGQPKITRVDVPPDAKATDMRRAALDGRRADGRGHDELRQVDCEVGYLPSNHGSALFTRGQTQALVSVTLGAPDEGLVGETVLGRRTDRFFLHYNFPPFSVGEVKQSRGPGRREIGHGALARRALEAVMPANDELPYTVRVVSDILESNGSSSMATVCGASLALMDAAVPLSGAVAGIAMGLVVEGDAVAILSDITGDEDQLGDMDFKVAGTAKGVTALQLDNKLGAVPLALIERALAQARRGIDQLLGRLGETLAGPRATPPDNAPQVASIKIPAGRVGTLIGPGGKTVSEIQSATHTRIDVKDDGRVRIQAKKGQDLKAAIARIEALTLELKVGEVYQAEVVTLKEYGAFVRIGDHEGLVHISELAPARVDKVEDVLTLGETINVKVIGADKRGRLELSRKAALA